MIFRKLPFAALLAVSLAAVGPVGAQQPDLMDISADHPGMLASWMQSRPVYSSAGQAIPATPPAERPSDWPNVARIRDLVISDRGQLLGIVVDSGGVLGIGSRQVLLPPAKLTPMRIGTESFFVTPLTQAELQALPEFDTTFVLR
ncbi:PRC-barrel domain-containing protein [Paracoccus sp. S1E-3]|uniref:PRC-barrel domain-containing protein n=1 Tax=Paracoccus sp. S1E-3 TaxID=2756130 RepID=UPI0015EFB007|nr:PRC-barrel domain-containing protein [Paracoccus sp. S1E-3]MBA4489918.1 PRC-barrel domain-containing protein [Paracoccus sp. S1E-3]